MTGTISDASSPPWVKVRVSTTEAFQSLVQVSPPPWTLSGHQARLAVERKPSLVCSSVATPPWTSWDT